MLINYYDYTVGFNGVYPETSHTPPHLCPALLVRIPMSSGLGVSTQSHCLPLSYFSSHRKGQKEIQ